MARKQGVVIKRIITAIVLLPLLILLLLKGSPLLFSVVVVGAIFVGLTEFYRMVIPGRKGEGLFAAIAGALVATSFLSFQPAMPIFAITVYMLFFSLVFLFRLQDIKQAAQETALVLMGLMYVSLLLSHLILLRNLPFGTQWIFLLLVIVMCGDSAAYYVGSSLGKTKLYPAVSPNKSVEGSLGGLAGSMAGAFIMKAFAFPQLSIGDCIATALLLGVLGQLGDLFESLMKRSCGVKDSGAIFPGHGGILDRLDSILFAAPAAFYYASFVFRA